MASLFTDPLKLYRAARRGAHSFLLHKPLNVSFEITHSCNAHCEHCDKGGPVKGEKLATPEQYGEICRQLRPFVAQISGGEPLLRKDILEVIQAIKQADPHLPVLVLVTNGWLLTLAKYLRFRAEGIDQFSVSLDYPDERHDHHRHIPGLFAHLNELVPRLSQYGYGDITLNCAIRRGNLHDLFGLVKKAQEWGVTINFSAYTPLRTGDWSHFISHERELKDLKEVIGELVHLRRQGAPILTSPQVLWRYYRFFRDGLIPNCRAGARCLVINPDGSLCPCAMLYETKYATQRELIQHFTRRNLCGGCYVSTRATTERPLGELLRDSLRAYRQFSSNRRRAC